MPVQKLSQDICTINLTDDIIDNKERAGLF